MSFVREYLLGRNLGKGTRSHLGYVALDSLSVGAQIAYHVDRDLVDYCMFVACINRFLCVELWGVKFRRVYSKCSALVYEILLWW